MSDLELRLWERAVREADEEVMRSCPTLCGGRDFKNKETAQQYAKRCIDGINRALANLAEAQTKLTTLQKGKK